MGGASSANLGSHSSPVQGKCIKDHPLNDRQSVRVTILQPHPSRGGKGSISDSSEPRILELLANHRAGTSE